MVVVSRGLGWVRKGEKVKRFINDFEYESISISHNVRAGQDGLDSIPIPSRLGEVK